jgi:hypothetical protein
MGLSVSVLSEAAARSQGVDPLSGDPLAVWSQIEASFNEPQFKPYNPQRRKIPHLEIDLPEAVAMAQFSRDVDPSIRSALLLEGSGKRTLRWPLHPFDQKYHILLKERLTEAGYKWREVTHFEGHLTSSRSLLLRDPESGAVFSFKTSTDRTPQGSGGLEDRPLPTRWARLAFELSEQLAINETELTTLRYLPEVGHLSFEPGATRRGDFLDMSGLVRALPPMAKAQANHLVTGFALQSAEFRKALSSKSGLAIAELMESLIRSYGRALAELNAKAGLLMTSAHGQNIRFEFDREWRPTGRVYLADLTDSVPVFEVFRDRGQSAYLANWIQAVGDTNPVVFESEESRRLNLPLLSSAAPPKSNERTVISERWRQRAFLKLDDLGVEGEMARRLVKTEYQLELERLRGLRLARGDFKGASLVDRDATMAGDEIESRARPPGLRCLKLMGAARF